MIGAAVHRFQVHVGAGAARESLEEIVDKFGLQIADESRRELWCRRRRRCVRPKSMAAMPSVSSMGIRKYPARLMPFLSPSALIERLAQSDADVFDGVVLIDVEIAFAGEFEIEAAMAGEQLEHVIEKANAGRDLVRAAAVNGEREMDVGLVGVASECFASFRCIPIDLWLSDSEFRDADFTHLAPAAVSFCSAVPMVMRTHPAHPGIAVAVAHQYAALLHATEMNSAILRADARENKVRVTGPVV